MLGRQATLGVLIVLLALCANGRAEIEPSGKADHASQTIPLKQVWAWQMPGTQDVRELEPKPQRLRHDSVANQIDRVLSKGLEKDESAGPGFVVLGQGEQALKNAFRVLVKHETPEKKFPANKKLSLVFYSHSSSQYVQIERVEIRSKKIVLTFRMVPHETKELSSHYALVPLNKLSTGKYQVELVRAPLSPAEVRANYKAAPEQYVKKIVCQPFSFTIDPANE